MLGICRGMQVMNIVKGGGIYQDIGVQAGTTLKHIQQAPRSYGTHSTFCRGQHPFNRPLGK